MKTKQTKCCKMDLKLLQVRCLKKTAWNNKLTQLFPDAVTHKEAVTQRCSVKKMFLEILQDLQKNNCAKASFLKMLQAWGMYL